MPFFVPSRELKRIEREASDSRKRASEAERRLEVERKAKDTLALALLDHVAVKERGYAISARMPQPEVPEVVETESERLERFKAENPALWAGYLQVAADNSKSQEEAEGWLVAQCTGQPLPYQM